MTFRSDPFSGHLFRSRPEPVALDLGDGTTVLIRWKKANSTSAAQALKKALKMIQEREKPEQAA